MIETTMEIITPAKAAEYLTHNKINRPLRSRRIDELMREMKSGNWKFTHQGIAFDEDGNLLDGQHRLTACVLSGISIQTMVTRGMPRDSARVIDTVAVRNFNDSHIFDSKERPTSWKNSSVQAALKTLVRHGYSSQYTLTNSELDMLFETFKDPVESLYRASCSRGKQAGAAINAAMLAALLTGGASEADIYGFYSVYTYGNTGDSSDKNVQAPFKLSHYITNLKEQKGKQNSPRVFNIAQNAIWQYNNSDKTTQLKQTGTHRYPVANLLNELLKGGNTNA